MKTFLGIDSGTQSTKVILYDADSKTIVAQSQSPHDRMTDRMGKSEQEASWWVQALRSAMNGISSEVRESVAAIGVSGQQHGFVPLDRDAAVLTPVKLWNDTTTAAECDEITKAFGGVEKLLNNVGNLILPGYTASKILWLKKHRPEKYEEMSTILLPHDYLNTYLTDQTTMEFGDASGTGFLNIRKREWDESLLHAMDPDRDLMTCLPDLIDPVEPAGHLTEHAAEELGLKPGIVISPGGGDNMMGAIGTGTNTDGSFTMSLGTSGTLYGYSDRPVIDPKGNLAAFCSSTGGWLPLLCTMNCTVATEHIRSLFQIDLEQMEILVNESEAGAAGIVTLPFFGGERIPNLPRAKASFMGLDTSNFGVANLLRSAMESALFGLKLGLESFTSLGFRVKEIKLIGGGSRSKAWRQMAANILNLPMVIPTCNEAAALGAALQALWVHANHVGNKMGINAIISEHVAFDHEKREEPEPEEVDHYESGYDLYRRYLESVTPLYK